MCIHISTHYSYMDLANSFISTCNYGWLFFGGTHVVSSTWFTVLRVLGFRLRA